MQQKEIETQHKKDMTAPMTADTHEAGEIEAMVHIVPATIIAILVLIMTFLQTIKTHAQKIPKI